MQTENFIMLYSCNCGVIVGDDCDLVANIDFNWYADKEKVLSIYETITAQSFDKKEVFKWRLRGYNQYNKYILQVAMPISLYNELMLDDNVSEDEKQGYLNDLVFDSSVNWQFENVKDELFEIVGTPLSMQIINLRPYIMPEELVN